MSELSSETLRRYRAAARTQLVASNRYDAKVTSRPGMTDGEAYRIGIFGPTPPTDPRFVRGVVTEFRSIGEAS